MARRARWLSWLTLAWLGIEAGVAVGGALIAGSVALLGFGIDSGIEALASIVVIWRFTGHRLVTSRSERRAQRLVTSSFLLLAPYIAIEGLQSLVNRERPLTSVVGIALTAGTAVLEPPLGFAKRRLGSRLGSAATAGEGTQNLLCAWLALMVLASLIANTVWGWWWLDGTVALLIAGWALIEARRTWQGETCACASPACDWPPIESSTNSPNRTTGW
jgi:divalent metal cation (Fe/Co/Zn/Cd) transporter